MIGHLAFVTQLMHVPNLLRKAKSALGGRHSTAVAFKLRAPAARVRFSAQDIFFSLLRLNDHRTAQLVDSAEA